METTDTFVRTEKDMADHLDNGVVGLHWVSADGIILWANRADYEPLGYTREEWVGHHAAEFHANHAALNDMSQRLAKGETIYNYPARLRHKNGSVQDVLIASSVLILIEAPSSTYHVVCWGWEKRPQERRRPQCDSTRNNTNFTVASIGMPAPCTSAS